MVTSFPYLVLSTGIFAPISKISKPGILVSANNSSRTSVSHGRVDTSHVTAKVDTGESIVILHVKNPHQVHDQYTGGDAFCLEKLVILH